METPSIPTVGRIVGFVFGFVFFGIGCSVLIYLWTQPFGGFGSPPLIFRIVGSFISLAFVAVGGGACFSALTGRGLAARFLPRRFQGGEFQGGGFQGGSVGRDSGSSRPAGRRYECPQCGAPLREGAEVSPSGDVRCGHCDAWFNVHGGVA